MEGVTVLSYNHEKKPTREPQGNTGNSISSPPIFHCFDCIKCAHPEQKALVRHNRLQDFCNRAGGTGNLVQCCDKFRGRPSQI